jgi:hypothetical protein
MSAIHMLQSNLSSLSMIVDLISFSSSGCDLRGPQGGVHIMLDN